MSQEAMRLEDTPQEVVDAVEETLAEFGHHVSGDCAVHVAHAAIHALAAPLREALSRPHMGTDGTGAR